MRVGVKRSTSSFERFQPQLNDGNDTREIAASTVTTEVLTLEAWSRAALPGKEASKHVSNWIHGRTISSAISVGKVLTDAETLVG